MPVTEKTWEIPLGRTGLFARLTWKRDGQEMPDAGDRVMVSASIILPNNQGSTGLAKALQFGRRAEVWGETLGSDWGYGGAYGRAITKCYTATTWAEAAAAAERWMAEALEPLLAALAAREQALVDAEGPEEKKLGTRQIERAGTTNRELR
jgi:hypothetical protein